MSHDHQWVLVPGVFPQNSHTDWSQQVQAEHLCGTAPSWWCGGLWVPGHSSLACLWTFVPRVRNTEWALSPHHPVPLQDLTALAQRRLPAQHGAQLKGTASGGFLACQKIPAPSPAHAEGSLQCRVLGLAEQRAVSSWQAQRWKQGQGWPYRHGEGHETGAVLACHSSPRCLSAQCFAVRSLGWVEIPEEDLAPGKSSIAVNNCIQQLSNSKCQGQGSADNWGEVRAWDGAQSRYLSPPCPGSSAAGAGCPHTEGVGSPGTCAGGRANSDHAQCPCCWPERGAGGIDRTVCTQGDSDKGSLSGLSPHIGMVLERPVGDRLWGCPHIWGHAGG